MLTRAHPIDLSAMQLDAVVIAFGNVVCRFDSMKIELPTFQHQNEVRKRKKSKTVFRSRSSALAIRMAHNLTSFEA